MCSIDLIDFSVQFPFPSKMSCRALLLPIWFTVFAGFYLELKKTSNIKLVMNEEKWFVSNISTEQCNIGTSIERSNCMYVKPQAKGYLLKEFSFCRCVMKSQVSSFFSLCKYYSFSYKYGIGNHSQKKVLWINMVIFVIVASLFSFAYILEW